MLNDKVILLTGGTGSFGKAFTKYVLNNYDPKKIIIYSRDEFKQFIMQNDFKKEFPDKFSKLRFFIGDVRDKDRLKRAMEGVDFVIHAAALKQVPACEYNPQEAIKTNIHGAQNVIDAALDSGVKKVVALSTDKAVNPTNVMGATKRACEMIIQYESQNSSHTEFVTTRFGNVLGSNGSVIPLFRRQIESGSPVTVTHPDIIRYFMTIPEAVSLVLEAGAMAKGGEIFVLDMGAPVKITTLAENLIRMYGKVPYKDVPIVFTGLRPGEKLFEELLMDEEGLKSTENKKIFIGNQIDIDEKELLRKLEILRNVADANDSERTVEFLADLVPTFNHKN